MSQCVEPVTLILWRTPFTIPLLRHLLPVRPFVVCFAAFMNLQRLRVFLLCHLKNAEGHFRKDPVFRENKKVWKCPSVLFCPFPSRAPRDSRAVSKNTSFNNTHRERCGVRDCGWVFFSSDLVFSGE